MGGNWHAGVGFAIDRSRSSHSEFDLIPALLRNNPGRVIHTFVPLSLSSSNWYRCNAENPEAIAAGNIADYGT